MTFIFVKPLFPVYRNNSRNSSSNTREDNLVRIRLHKSINFDSSYLFYLRFMDMYLTQSKKYILNGKY